MKTGMTAKTRMIAGNDPCIYVLVWKAPFLWELPSASSVHLERFSQRSLMLLAMIAVSISAWGTSKSMHFRILSLRKFSIYSLAWIFSLRARSMRLILWTVSSRPATFVLIVPWTIWSIVMSLYFFCIWQRPCSIWPNISVGVLRLEDGASGESTIFVTTLPLFWKLRSSMFVNCFV